MYFNQKKIRGDKEPYEGGEMLVPVPVSQLGECTELISQMLDNILSPGKQTKLLNFISQQLCFFVLFSILCLIIQTF